MGTVWISLIFTVILSKRNRIAAFKQVSDFFVIFINFTFGNCLFLVFVFFFWLWYFWFFWFLRFLCFCRLRLFSFCRLSFLRFFIILIIVHIVFFYFFYFWFFRFTFWWRSAFWVNLFRIGVRVIFADSELFFALFFYFNVTSKYVTPFEVSVAFCTFDLTFAIAVTLTYFSKDVHVEIYVFCSCF